MYRTGVNKLKFQSAFQCWPILRAAPGVITEPAPERAFENFKSPVTLSCFGTTSAIIYLARVQVYLASIGANMNVDATRKLGPRSLKNVLDRTGLDFPPLACISCRRLLPAVYTSNGVVLPATKRGRKF